MRIVVILFSMVLVSALFFVTRRVERQNALPSQIPIPQPPPPVMAAKPLDVAEKIVAAAKAQIGTVYCAQYFVLGYPNGDPPREKGACTDVVVRALRGTEIDLQVLVHEDMKRRFKEYPQKWGLGGPDSNIDHRRVPNHICFLSRFGLALPMEVSAKTASEWKSGDIVYWKLNGGLDHCGIVSDARNADGIPLVVHNLGRCCEEDCLTKWKIQGHFRYPKVK